MVGHPVPPATTKAPRVSLRDLNLSRGYVSSQGDLIGRFYEPCLDASCSYDRSAGYFRSSLFALVGVALSGFALGGGKMRLVCSPSLPEEDVAAIEEGLVLRDIISGSLIRDLTDVLQSPVNRPVVRLLATLVALHRLEVKIAYKPGAAGIYHEKRGIFSDGTNRVSFTGSNNETLAAWDPRVNHESFEVFVSWGDPSDVERVARHAREFEALWGGDVAGLTVTALPDVPRDEILRHADKDGIESAVTRVRQLFARDQARRKPDVPKRHLQDHQVTAIQSWSQGGHRGIIDHVTGAGKTLVALEIIRNWIRISRPALVLVPTELLSKQWRAEIENSFQDLTPNLLTAGAGSPRAFWERAIGDMTRGDPALGARITIATMPTAATETFIRRTRGGDHLLVIADEVHRIGSPQNRRFLQVDAGGRLGLSATPQRFNDPVGSSAILDYFGPVLEPHFGIPDAIRAHRLVPYDYNLHVVELTTHEVERWRKLTDQIALEYARLPERDGTRQVTDGLVMLLIRRARIAKKAAGKPMLAQEVIARDFQHGQRWLVYCDDGEQLKLVRQALEEKRLPTMEYRSSMAGDKEATLAFFRDHGGVLVAIRCLDEGVDIPTVDHALILASSTNSREYIQRRGRVLRTAPGKFSAAIHDALVLIPDNTGAYAALPSEIRRAAEFASTARNRSASVQLALLLQRSLNASDFELEATDGREGDTCG